jgi:hypothetical protein
VRTLLSRYLVALGALALANCGGGGNDSSSPPPTAVSVVYASPQIYTVGTAITPLMPTVSGSPTTFSVSPTLPAGLTMSSTTGAISGTPAAIMATTSFRVTAANATRSASATISLAVNDVPPGFTYPRASYTYTTDMPIVPMTPSTTGGPVVSWAVDGSLPAGLSLNTSTGEISGTPTAAADPVHYRVTANNSGGSATVDVTIAILSGVLYDLGHIANIRTIKLSGSRVLSVDENGLSLLSDVQTGAVVARFQESCAYCGPPRLAGNVLVIRRANGFDIHDWQSGALLRQITAPKPDFGDWDLATDGSYIVDRSDTGIKVWSITGTELFARAGDYTNIHAIAAPDEFRFAKGTLVARVIQSLSIPSGTLTLTPLSNGYFQAWFDDGERLITRDTDPPGTVYVYSRAGVLLESAHLPGPLNSSYGGHADWYWEINHDGITCTVFKLGSGNTPVLTLKNTSYDPRFRGSVLFSGAASDVLRLYDLSGAVPVSTDYPLPMASTAFDGPSGTEWAIGNYEGTVIAKQADGDPVHLTLGKPDAITGSETRFAISFSDGRIEYFDASTRALEGSMGYVHYSAHYIELSRDGNVLGTRDSFLGPLRLYSLPSQQILTEFPALTYPDVAQNFSLSDDGAFVGDSINYTRRVMSSEGAIVWSDTSTPAGVLRLSPSGTRMAVSQFTEGAVAYGSQYWNEPTHIHDFNGPTGEVTGWPVGWLDDSRLLVNQYEQPPPAPRPVYLGAIIVDATGQKIGSLAMDELVEFQRVDADSIYSPPRNAIYSTIDGSKLWQGLGSDGSDVVAGAVAGNFVVYQSGIYIRADLRN